MHKKIIDIKKSFFYKLIYLSRVIILRGILHNNFDPILLLESLILEMIELKKKEFGSSLGCYFSGNETTKKLMHKALFERSVKNFVRGAFFVSLTDAGNFLLYRYAEKFLRSKFWLYKQKYAWRIKFFALRLNRALFGITELRSCLWCYNFHYGNKLASWIKLRSKFVT